MKACSRFWLDKFLFPKDLFNSYEELNKSLGKRNLSNQNLEQAFIHILDEKVILVEKKADFKVLRKKENGLKEFDKIFDISSLLIANKVSYKIKKEEINSFIERVKAHDK